MNAMRAFFSKFQKNERGVTAIEYGLIAIAMAALLTVVFSTSSKTGIIAHLNTGFSHISTNLDTATKSSGITTL